jgi:hypothetical protein
VYTELPPTTETRSSFASVMAMNFGLKQKMATPRFAEVIADDWRRRAFALLARDRPDSPASRAS